MLREFVGAPRSVSLNIKFTKAFWVANTPAVGLQFADVLRFAEETLKLKPTREETKEIYVLVKNTALESGDIDTAERYMGKMIAGFAGDDTVAESAFAISRAYFWQKRFPEALKWLNWIVDNAGDGGPTPLVYVGLADTYEKLGDEAAMIRYLKIAAQDTKVVPTARGIMDRSDTRQVALVRLGKYYKARGDLEEALKYFTTWKPNGGGCGNCMAQMRYEKDLYIAQCLIGLGREDEALEKYLMPHLLVDGGELYSDAEIPKLVVSIYEKISISQKTI